MVFKIWFLQFYYEIVIYFFGKYKSLWLYENVVLQFWWEKIDFVVMMKNVIL